MPFSMFPTALNTCFKGTKKTKSKCNLLKNLPSENNDQANFKTQPNFNPNR